jgi:hypothetical protein
MSSKIKETILKRIRSRTEEATDSRADLPADSAPPGPVSLREAQFADFANVSAMNRRLGQGADSLENWYRLWRDNPALQQGRTPRIGWLLESGGAVVGFLGSIPLAYSFGGASLAAAATCRLAVEPAFRSSTPLLVTSFFRQKDVDLFLNTTATPAAGKIVAALRAIQLPQPDYGRVLFWVLRPRKFMHAVLQKTGVYQTLTKFGSSAGALALASDIAVRRRTPRGNAGKYSVKDVELNDLGHEFESFWAEQEKNPARLFAKRSPEIMRWHFQPPGSAKIAKVLACYASHGLAGYAVVRHEPPAKEGLARAAIADLMVNDDDPAIVDSLLAAAYQSAKTSGSDVLEIMGFPEKIRASFLKWRPYSRDYPACPYFYKTRDRQLQEKLSSRDAWYACPFDGDATLWP